MKIKQNHDLFRIGTVDLTEEDLQSFIRDDIYIVTNKAIYHVLNNKEYEKVFSNIYPGGWTRPGRHHTYTREELEHILIRFSKADYLEGKTFTEFNCIVEILRKFNMQFELRLLDVVINNSIIESVSINNGVLFIKYKEKVF